MAKKDGRLRLIADCRRSNCWFAPPDKVKLCTAEALSRVSLEPGGELHVCTADLKDAFYHFSLPDQLRPYFGMRPLRAGEAGVADGDSGFQAGDWVYPRLKILPMGWSHALWWCQSIHQRIVSRVGAKSHNCLEDKAAVPDGACMHLEYVDNFVVLGTSAESVKSLAGAGVQALRDSGLVVHEVEQSSGSIKVLGWEFEKTIMRPKPVRIWRVILAVKRLLQIGSANGRQLEKLLGHATFIGLGRREVLSIFGESYTYIQRKYHSSGRIWKSVRRELEIFCGIAPLIWRDLSLPWGTEVTAIDASIWGLGATTAVFPVEEVAEYGRFSERWRFESESLSKLRATAFGVDVTSDSDEACAVQWAASQDEARSGLKPIRVVEGKSDEQVFKQLPFEAVDRFWKVVGRHKWRRVEAIPVLEARASLYAVKHALRSQEGFGKRHLVLSDSISAVCSLDRGRGKSFGMRRVTQQVCALTLASNTVFGYRWLPSEWNPADGPSRGSMFAARAQRYSKDDPPAHKCGGAGQRGQSGKEAAPTTAADSEDTEQKASRAQAADETVGEPERGFSGGKVQDKIPRVLDQVCEIQPHEVQQGDLCPTGGSAVVRLLEPSFPAGGGSVPCPVCRGRCALQAPSFEEPETDGSPLEQAIYAGVEKARPTKISIAHALGGDMLSGARGFQAEEDRSGAHDAFLLRTIPETWGSLQDTGDGLSASCQVSRPVFTNLVSGSASNGVGGTIQDWRVRRDRDVRPSRFLVHPCEHSPVAQVEAEEKGRADLLRDTSILKEGHGGHFQEAPAGSDRAAPSLPAAPWWSKSGFPVEKAFSRGDSAPWTVEEFFQRPPIRKRRATESAATPPARRQAQGSGSGRRQYRKDRPEPALGPGRAWTVPVFLEIFSGSGHLSHGFHRHAGMLSLLWDISLGLEYDLRRAANRRKIADWMRCGMVRAFHLGTPRNSFTRARDVPPGPPPLRSDLKPLGLEGLRPGDQIKVLDGNCFMRFSAYILRLGLTLMIPGTMENPQRSRIWLCPPLTAILRRKAVFWQVTHYCAWGKPFRTATAFLSVHVPLLRLQAGKCVSSKRGVCQYTGKPHRQLLGQDSAGNWKTRLAQPYPVKMCTAIAKDFKDYEISKIASKFEHYVGR